MPTLQKTKALNVVQDRVRTHTHKKTSLDLITSQCRATISYSLIVPDSKMTSDSENIWRVIPASDRDLCCQSRKTSRPGPRRQTGRPSKAVQLILIKLPLPPFQTCDALLLEIVKILLFSLKKGDGKALRKYFCFYILLTGKSGGQF